MDYTQELMKLPRAALNAYMQDVWGEDGSEWDSKTDLVSDIVRFGKARDCLEYNS